MVIICLQSNYMPHKTIIVFGFTCFRALTMIVNDGLHRNMTVGTMAYDCKKAAYMANTN